VDFYWSSTTDARDSSFVWVVRFFDGLVNSVNKGESVRVRAVRGGW